MFNVQKIVKLFQQADSTVSLFDQASYQFQDGRSYAIMGPSGSGKSTLLHVLMGIESISSGDVLYGDQIISKMSLKEKEALRKSLGIMFQQPYLVAEMTVLENVMLKAFLHESVGDQERVRAKKLLDRVGLASKINVFPAVLSGGERQRVALLRGLLYKPKWLLIDEPTAGLDEDSGKEIVSLIKQYQSLYTMGIIVTTHNKQVAESMDEIVCIRNKKLEKFTG